LAGANPFGNSRGHGFGVLARGPACLRADFEPGPDNGAVQTVYVDVREGRRLPKHFRIADQAQRPAGYFAVQCTPCLDGDFRPDSGRLALAYDDGVLR